MPLASQALGAALNEKLTLHSTLCRREAGAFQKALASGDDVVVACTQESRLFQEIAQQTEGAAGVPIRGVVDGDARGAHAPAADRERAFARYRTHGGQRICRDARSRKLNRPACRQPVKRCLARAVERRVVVVVEVEIA